MTHVVLDSKLPQLIAESPARARLAVESACVLITGRAMSHSRVRTGFMRSEWQFDMDEIHAEGHVFNLVRYAVYNEYGTRYMSAKPMLRPAVAEITPEFEALVADIYAL